jgi:hypothetical protein
MTAAERACVEELARAARLVLSAYESDDLVPASDQAKVDVRMIATRLRDAAANADRVLAAPAERGAT